MFNSFYFMLDTNKNLLAEENNTYTKCKDVFI